MPRTASKYGGSWQTQRTTYWLPRVQRGEVSCWRCGRPIAHNPLVRGGGWDMGHRPYGQPAHPEHALTCNRSAGGRIGARITHAKRRRARLPAW